MQLRSRRTGRFSLFTLLAASVAALLSPTAALASEADIVLPDLRNQSFFGVNGQQLLTIGLALAALGIVFGLVIYKQLKALPVHRAMGEVSELIYETCKTYLLTQGKFIMILWVCIAAVMVAYFGFLRHDEDPAATAANLQAQGLTPYSNAVQVPIILLFSLIGIAGSYAVAWFGMR